MKNTGKTWPCGLMDKASDFESEDCEFESRHGQFLYPTTDMSIFTLFPDCELDVMKVF